MSSSSSLTQQLLLADTHFTPRLWISIKAFYTALLQGKQAHLSENHSQIGDRNLSFIDLNI